MSRSNLARLSAVLAVVAIGTGCDETDVTDVRLKIEANPPASTLLGVAPGYPAGGNAAGQHYEFWADLADGSTVLIGRFVIVPLVSTPEQPDAQRYQAPAGAPHLRDFDTGAYIGFVSNNCTIGPCGGSRFIPTEDLSSAVVVYITIEDDSHTGDQPAGDVYLRGPVAPYGRGSLRGSIGVPTGLPLPRGEVTIIPLVDKAEL